MMNIHQICPTLYPCDPPKTEYVGYVQVLNDEFRVHIHLPSAKSIRNASIECEWKLQQILRGHEYIIQQRLSQCSNLESFLVEFKSIIERLIENNPNPPRNTSSMCSKVISEIELLGWERYKYHNKQYTDASPRLLDVDPAFQKLSFSVTDDGQRKHILKIRLSQQYPQVAPTCICDIPARFDVHWSSKNTLTDIYNQFVLVVSKYQEFWNMVAEIDKGTWVLEPEKPTFNATQRRIAVDTNASLQLSIDPSNPRILPECRFLGADHVVNPLRDNMNSNLHNWDETKSLLCNLQNLLGKKFPSPQTTRKEDYSVECGICYAYRLETEIPTEACDDPRCAQPFHQSCLYEWLRSLPSSRQSFNTIFGECPFCEKPITVKMPLNR